MSPRTAPPPPPRDDAGTALAHGTDLLKAVAGPLSLLTVLLYYFGWLRSSTIARYWGYTPEMIGLGNEDYLLRSVVALYRPLATGVLLLLLVHHLAGWARRHVLARPEGDARLRRLATALLVSGACLLVVGALRLDAVDVEAGRVHWYVTGTALLVGTGALWCGGWVRAARGAGGPGAGRGRTVPLVTTMTALAVALVGVFVLTTQFASRVGTGQVQRTLADLPLRPRVTVYSEDRLHLAGAGVVEEPLDGGQRYGWRTTGLRLLTQGNGQLVLLPGAYSSGSAQVYVVPVGDGVRLDLDRTVVAADG